MRHAPDAETSRYLAYVYAIPTLGREEELALARRYQEQGDARAKQRLLQANLRHVLPYAVRYGDQGVSTADLIAQGNLALVAALERFEPARGLRFSNYAGHWVRAEMLAWVLQHRSLVGGGRGPLRAKYVFQLRRQFRSLMAQLGDREACYEVLARRHGRSVEKIRAIMQRVDSRDASTDAPLGQAGQGGSLGDQLVSPESALDQQVETAEERGQLQHAVGRATADLSERERFIMHHRLMADAELRLSLVQIGAHFGVSRERARQLEASLKTKLKRRLADVRAFGMPAAS